MARPEEVEHGHWHGKIVRVFPERYAPSDEELAELSKWEPLTREEAIASAVQFAAEKGYPSGTVAKVVMVSRLGDCGLTRDLAAEHGYDIRVYPECLEDAAADR